MQRAGNQRLKAYLKERGLQAPIDFNNKAVLQEYKGLLQKEVNITTEQDKADEAETQEEKKVEEPAKPKPVPKFSKAKQSPNVNNYMFKPVKFEAPKPVVFEEPPPVQQQEGEDEEFQDAQESNADMTLVSQILSKQKQNDAPQRKKSDQRDTTKKAISSEDYNQREESKWERDVKISRFSNATQISSAMYFNRNEEPDNGLGDEAERIALAAKDKASKLKNKAKEFWSDLTNRY